MDAVRLLPPSRDAPYGSLGLKTKAQNTPVELFAACPPTGAPVGALSGSCLSLSPGSRGISVLFQGIWRCSEALWFSLASGYRHPARLGLVRHSECDALAEVAAMELVKKINIPHHTCEMWPAEMLLFCHRGELWPLLPCCRLVVKAGNSLRRPILFAQHKPKCWACICFCECKENKEKTWRLRTL